VSTPKTPPTVYRGVRLEFSACASIAAAIILLFFYYAAGGRHHLLLSVLLALLSRSAGEFLERLHMAATIGP